ncbi:MAG: monovalent cation/H+ antiporter subunit A [Halothiobacillus sp. 24-54-40]|jgi:multicomponent K+:H+ antiporter subunit A|nr:MAG: monovalent cation/H+ antiporter subunit A [Halothiobacillus sp. 24-54-40]OZA81074.1 MAG: monovalent cation/H+ antiporter subunit A [Halothiobacillus sp. 39-53-45]HQS01622.1 monovalent cation/H+ antiporter subunit A [Halothiobacillus sp.]HQS28199.1 monovalent cation/H+ antiporter subunit A [Halothiobacillus sp.]
MNSLIAIVLLPFFSAPFVAWFGARVRPAAAGIAFSITLACLLLLGISAWGADLSQAQVISFSWIPLIGLDFAFRLDGLSLLFSGIILIIGLLIIVYAQYYLALEDSAARFFASLMLFMGAMLGIVLSENLIQLVVFWELTSLSSFLLISFWQHRNDARTGARMALTLTGFGGLALLGGVLLLGHVVGSYNLSVVLNSGELVKASPLYLPILILILLGVFTKSAQFPFHFWLPNAMAAPTPVSAYLHSATMVKAGIFLLARFFPVLAGTEAWVILVGGAGLITFLLGAYTALFKHDLKGLLAYSTLSHLGLITLLMGFGTPLALVAGLFHLINHATFKASLFMVAGIVDHETGTRDMRRLGGLARHMPRTALLAIIAASAMAGVPLLNGFLSKELFFTETLDVSTNWLLPILVTLGAVFSVAYSIRFIHDTFFGEPSPDLPTNIHEPPLMMRIPVLILVVACLAVGLAPALLVGGILNLSVSAALNAPAPVFSLALWHGFNAPLMMSGVAMLGGLLVYIVRRPLTRWHELTLGRLNAKTPYNFVLRALQLGSETLTQAFDQGRLQPMAFWTLAITLGAGLIGFASIPAAPLFGTEPRATPFDGITALGMLIMMGLALSIAFIHAQRFIALLLLSVIGLGVSLLFVRYSAPDLALTQLSVEVVTLILMLLALRYLPQKSPPDRTKRVWPDALLAGVIGAGAAALTYAIMSRDFASIAGYFIENSLSLGGGHNVVNVILVDFRGYDTFGEISVLALAALGIYALLQGIKLTPLAPPPIAAARLAHPLLLQTATHLLLPMTLLFGAYILLRGHNAPGGGFIAGLIVASAAMMQLISHGQPHDGQALSTKAHGAIALGLLLALGTGLASIVLGYPFLTSTFTHVNLPLIGEVEVASAMMFDLGVFFVVMGAGILMLTRIVQIQAQESHTASLKEPQ